jgi:hypothetical protein
MRYFGVQMMNMMATYIAGNPSENPVGNQVGRAMNGCVIKVPILVIFPFGIFILML